MQTKKPRPLDDPPAASSSEEEEEEESEEQEKVEESESEHEQEQAQQQQQQESEEEDESEDEEEEDLEKTQKKKDPESSTSSEEEEPVSQKSPRASDFTIKPIEPSKSTMEQTPVSKSAKRSREESSGGGENGRTSKPKMAKASAINRLWSEEDEIAILKGVFEFQSKIGKDISTSTHHVQFHEFVKKSLHVDVSTTQLMDKVRRLKKKYRNNAAKSTNGEDPVFSKPHEFKSFQLSKKIWAEKNSNDDYHVKSNTNTASKSSKKSSASDKLVVTAADTGYGTKEEGFLKEKGAKTEVNDGDEKDFGKLYPFLMNGSRSEYMSNELLKSNFSLVGSSKLKELDSKWKKLGMEEAEILVKRMDLMREQTRMVLDAMKSSES